MTDPYKVLGVSPTASTEEIKNAYKQLAKKYHPDNYASSPLEEVATEKMKEINEAYDQIMNERRVGGNGSQYSQSGGQQYNQYGSAGGSSSYPDIRRLIMQNRYEEAETLLDGVPMAKRDAEWYFLKGSVYYSRGWLDDAFAHFSSACQMNPNNPEYRAAYQRMMWQRQGNMGGSANGQYRTNQNRNMNNCSSCDCCSALLCSDCCCECMGGDLIPCC